MKAKGARAVNAVAGVDGCGLMVDWAGMHVRMGGWEEKHCQRRVLSNLTNVDKCFENNI